MKILQKLKFIFARHSDSPTEARPDDMTSKKAHDTCANGNPCCVAPAVAEGQGDCCEHDCDCK